ncbi:MAG TPA: galactitol-1-phosphate 5-dehydrogenase [Bacilli bacterium]
MKALVYEGPRLMNMRDMPIPIPNEDEVLIRMERVGICGSELSGYLGHNSLRVPPLVMGHEFSGEVAGLGNRVSSFKEGDRVTANPLVSCGICRDCQSGAAHLCSQRKLIGAHRPGAFAEYVTVPEGNVYLLPGNVSYDAGALTEPFACAVHVCRLLHLTPTDRLLIVGAGPIGLFILQAAHVYGLTNIVIMDLNRERLEIAASLGGITASSSEELKKFTPAGGFETAVDAVGMNATRNQCVLSVRNGGRVAFTGLHEADSTLPINTVIRNEIQIYGAFAYAPNDFEIALQWLSEGKVSMLDWTLHAPLEEGGACFDKLIEGPGKIAKILLTL